MHESVARHEAVGAVGHVPLLFCMVAGLAPGAEGLALADDALSRLERTGVIIFLPKAHRVRGVLLAGPGDAGGAEDQFMEAIRIARR